MERAKLPSQASLAAAALGFSRHSPLSPLSSRSRLQITRSRRRGSSVLSSRHSPLGFSRHSQPPPRLSPLGFTRSRLSGSLAVAVLTGSPPSSLSTRGDDTAPADELDLWICRSTFICFARLAPFLAAHLLHKVSPFLGFSFDFIFFARIALRRPRSVFSCERTLVVWSPSSQVRSMSYDLDRFSAASEP